MSNKEELMKLTNAELAAMCKEKGFKIYNGKTRIKKEAMVDLLLSDGNVTEDVKPEPKVENENATVTTETPKETPKETETTTETIQPWLLGGKDDLIQKAEVGTLIAFIDEKGKPRTGKMVNRSSSRRVIKIETEFNWTFLVPYDKVLWVRFGSRWPRAIYTMLKEYKNGKRPNIIAKDEEESEDN